MVNFVLLLTTSVQLEGIFLSLVWRSVINSFQKFKWCWDQTCPVQGLNTMTTETELWCVCDKIDTHTYLWLLFWNFGAYLEPWIQDKYGISPCETILDHRVRFIEIEALHWYPSLSDNLEMVVVVLLLFKGVWPDHYCGSIGSMAFIMDQHCLWG